MKNESKIVVVPATKEEVRIMLNFITQQAKSDNNRFFPKETLTEDDELDAFLFFKNNTHNVNKIIVSKDKGERIYFNSLMISRIPLEDLSTKKVENRIAWHNTMYEFLDGKFKEIDETKILDY